MSSKLLLLFVSFKSWPIMTVLSLMMPKFLFFRLKTRLQFSMAPTRLSSTIEMTPKCSKFNWTYEQPASVYTANFFLENWAWEKEKNKLHNHHIIYILFDHCLRPISVDKSLGYFRTICHFKLKVILVFWLLLLRVSGDNYN